MPITAISWPTMRPRILPTGLSWARASSRAPIGRSPSTGIWKAIISPSSIRRRSFRARLPMSLTTKPSAAICASGSLSAASPNCAELPRETWGDQENNGFDFVRIFFPNVSAFLAPELAQIAQLFPGRRPTRTAPCCCMRGAIRRETMRTAPASKP